MATDSTLPPPSNPKAEPTREGALVLADISGYTTFMARSELEHSQYLIGQLLEALIAAAGDRLVASQVEGDAVFFVGSPDCRALLACLKECYVAFHHKIRDLHANTPCVCNACKLAPTLTVKFIGHYGRYSIQRVGPAQMAHGADVIVPHRLAKNGVPSREYVLVTSQLLAQLPEGEQPLFTLREDDAGELGALATAYVDFAPRREQLLSG